MANVKISGLPEASAGTVLNTDTIVGVFNGITKKCKLSSINLDLLSDGTNYKRTTAAGAADANAIGALIKIANNKLFINAEGTGFEYSTGVKIGSFTHNLSSTAKQSITGIGFKPSEIWFFYGGNEFGNAGNMLSIGVDCTSGKAQIAHYESSSFTSSSDYSIMLFSTSPSFQVCGYASSFDSDGFSLYWVIGYGTPPSQSITIKYLARR